MNKISVVIITFNEEKNIARCINSVQNIADEIVVVDSYSTDTTKEICLQYQVKFVENIFEGYVKQKNFAISQATYPLILSLDADEALSETLMAEIQRVKIQKNADSYQMPRLTNYCGTWIRHTDWYPDRKIRLFDRNKACWQGINLHETLEINPDATLQRLKGDILHYSFYSIGQHIAQLNKFTDMGAKEAFEKGRKAPVFLLLASPLAKFISSYFLRLGFLDGYGGFLVCSISSFASFLKYAKLRKLHKDNT